MAKQSVTFEMVQKIGLTLPEVEVGTSYGARCLKVRGKMFACPAINKSAEPNTLAIRVDVEQRDELMAADPATYYITDHYAPYPSVLVRLSRLPADALPDLLRMAWQYVSAMSKRPARRPTAGRVTGRRRTKR